MLILGLEFLDFPELIDHIRSRSFARQTCIYGLRTASRIQRRFMESLLGSQGHEGLNVISFTLNELREQRNGLMEKALLRK